MMHEQDELNNRGSTVKNTLRYRIRNSCGTDGKTLRIVCFTGLALLIVLMSVLIHNDNHNNDNNSLRGPSASTQIYSDYDWMELAPPVQQAAVKLGWDQRSWNMDLDTASSIHQWEELSKEQKAAATLLGYNKETWCTDTDDNVVGNYYNAEQQTGVPSNVYSSSDTESDTASDTSSDTSSETDSATMDESLYYRDYDWNELPASAQEAAAKFGYTTAEQWTNQIEFGTDWDALTEELRAAAVVLGYTKDTWCLDDSLSASESSISSDQLTDDVSLSGSEDIDTQEPQLTDDVSLSGSEDTTEPTDSVTSSPTDEDTSEDLSNEDWMDLPNDMKNAAISLGYNQEKWDETMDDGDIMPFDKKWNELTDTQQDAVSMLFGYNPETWDEEYLQSIMNQIDEQDWDELTPDIQQAATILGFTQNSWDNADNDDDASYVEPPSITLIEWTELTEEQQLAATTLGWNEQKWSFDRSI